MGRFPLKYSWGDRYAVVLYDYDSNAILTRAMKNRTKEAMTKIYK